MIFELILNIPPLRSHYGIKYPVCVIKAQQGIVTVQNIILHMRRMYGIVFGQPLRGVTARVRCRLWPCVTGTPRRGVCRCVCEGVCVCMCVCVSVCVCMCEVKGGGGGARWTTVADAHIILLLKGNPVTPVDRSLCSLLNTKSSLFYQFA